MSDAANVPRVTVVVASYNHRAYIERTIASLVAQDYPWVEILVIDDGSTDGSGEFLERLRSKYPFRLIRRVNGGLISVINLGIKEASGEFVVFHASDDESFSYRIRQQVTALLHYPNAAFISSNVEFLRENGRSAGTLRPVTGKITELSFESLFVGRASVSSVASMYRTAALRDMGTLDASYLAEDPQIFWRVTRLGYSWIQSSAEPVIRYRMLFSSQSRTRMQLLEQQLVRLVDEFSDHPLHRRASARARSGLFAASAEIDKQAAIHIAREGHLDWCSLTTLRGIVKLVVPIKFHHIFKRAGAAPQDERRISEQV